MRFGDDFMSEVLRSSTFVMFLALGFLAAALRDPGRRRYAVDALILYVLAIHAFLALAGKDAWPFTTYPLIQKTSHGEREYRKIVLYGVDGGGSEWEVDPDAWSPVSPPVLMQWFVADYPALTGAEREESLRFLLRKAEQQRQRRVRHLRPAKQRLLHSLAAPDWWLYRRPEAVSAKPFVALRVYAEHFSPRTSLSGVAPRRELMAEGRL